MVDVGDRIGVRGGRAVRVPFVAPRNQPHLVVGRAAAAEHRRDHRLRPEQALHPAERPMGAVPLGPGVTPQAGLESEVDEHAVRDQPQPDQPRGGPGRARAAAGRR